MPKIFTFALKAVASAMPILGVASASMASVASPDSDDQIATERTIAALTRVIVDDPMSPAAAEARRALAALAGPSATGLNSLSQDLATPDAPYRLSGEGEPPCDSPYCFS